MKMTFTGRVLFANAVAASGVEVHVVDRNTSSGQDEDLTITPGSSDSSGHFTVVFDPANYRAALKMPVSHKLNRMFSWDAGIQPLSLPNLSDAPFPSLQFSYSYNGQPSLANADLQPLQHDYRLPETQPLQFLPSKDGFKFINSFPGYFLPISIPALPFLPSVPPNYGLCGGMSSASYDYYLSGIPIPSTGDVPSEGSPLQAYLFKRSIDSFGAFGQSVVKVGCWTALPDGTINGTQKLTFDEFANIKSMLDNQQAVLIGLIYESATNLSQVLKKIWDNHQVLATSYTQNADRSVDLHIYDPNFPLADDVVIHCQPVTVNAAGVSGFQCTELVGNRQSINVRGFFAMTYTPVEPPTV